MDRNRTSWKIVNEYNKKAEFILDIMMHILLKAQRKVDDKEYRKILKTIERK